MFTRYGYEYLVDIKGNPVHCNDCAPKRKIRARYKCIECSWCMCRRHALEHFKPSFCHKK